MNLEAQGPAPHLASTSRVQFQILEEKLLSHAQPITQWFEQEWQKHPAPIYGSVDLRNAGFKLAPVDMNLFPAGFNNLNPTFLSVSIEAARTAIHRLAPHAQRILLVPENHTRNVFYWENIKALSSILTNAGYDVQLGSLMGPIFKIAFKDGQEFLIEGIERKAGRIQLSHFVPDLILLNNDLSNGIPSVLHGIEQPILPPAELGWFSRLKSEHFQYYAQVAEEFSGLIGLDPWSIAPLFRHCGEMDFMKGDGEEALAEHVSALLNEIQKQYDHYHITSKPFVIVKADAGTYGMAVMTVRSAEEVRRLNRKQRAHMAKTKSGQPVHRVIVQEGVYTFETWGDAVAEPVVYLWGEQAIGGFYRVHQSRGPDENLNSPGMQFEPLPFEKPCHQPPEDAGQNRFYTYGVIARLSMLAAAREIQALRKGEKK